MNDTQNQKLEILANTLLDDSLNHIDGELSYRLAQLRKNALAQLSGNQTFIAENSRLSPTIPGWLAPVSAVTAFASIVIISASIWFQPTSVLIAISPVEELALLSDKQNFEFYENLDFYIWLDETNEAS